ncbi:MAG: glutamyl-Q tRNA(Asp) synthetase [Oscillospiraceae bacterium]|nr:glutamyl-Q tRNA(Asp) synthetase [Oscillospiraceae bacterium]
MKRPVVGRFAPSPSGYMHMGNLLAMLLAWLDCRSLNGEMVFRMEDLDPARSKPAFAAAMADDLRWLGLDWDRGWPEDALYAQSMRTAIYEEAFETLKARDLVYPCWCTRSERLAAASAPHPGEREFDGGCRCARMTKAEREAMENVGRRPAWKLRCPDEVITVPDGHYGAFTQNPAREAGDFIIRRADGVFAYQLAVSVDDMLMGVTRVVRGRDLLSSAPRQKWLIETLGGTAPDYCHCPLLTGGTGKLSKRLGSMSTQVLRKEKRPEEVVGELAFLCGLTDIAAPITARELIPGFSWEKVRTEDVPLGE